MQAPSSRQLTHCGSPQLSANDITERLKPDLDQRCSELEPLIQDVAETPQRAENFDMITHDNEH